MTTWRQRLARKRSSSDKLRLASALRQGQSSTSGADLRARGLASHECGAAYALRAADRGEALYRRRTARSRGRGARLLRQVGFPMRCPTTVCPRRAEQAGTCCLPPASRRSTWFMRRADGWAIAAARPIIIASENRRGFAELPGEWPHRPAEGVLPNDVQTRFRPPCRGSHAEPRRARDLSAAIRVLPAATAKPTWRTIAAEKIAAVSRSGAFGAAESARGRPSTVSPSKEFTPSTSTIVYRAAPPVSLLARDDTVARLPSEPRSTRTPPLLALVGEAAGSAPPRAGTITMSQV